jgi:hypothetical protein
MTDYGEILRPALAGNPDIEKRVKSGIYVLGEAIGY